MTNTQFSRRQFFAQTAIAGGLLAMAGDQRAVANERGKAFAVAPKDSVRAEKPLRILILGGTGFLGPYHVRVALERGHQVAVFSRGKSSAELPAGVERLIGDRNKDLESIKHRDWDAVLDIVAYVPSEVRTLGRALKERVKHYTCISSVAVYEDRSGYADEQSKVLEYKGAADPYSVISRKGAYHYGTFKVLCEREAEKQFPGKTLKVRPGVIEGPGDNIGRFTYLCARMQAGGEMLAAGDPLMPMQIIDVRDMAECVIRMMEAGETGPVNLVGPALPMGWAEMLGGLRAALAASVKLTWVPIPWVQEQQVLSWSPLLVWPTEMSIPGLMRMSNDKARAKGLTFRPLALTAADTLAWFNGQPVEQRSKLLLGGALAESMQRERELLAAWHARQSKG